MLEKEATVFSKLEMNFQLETAFSKLEMTFNDLQPSMLYFTSLIGSIVSPLILNQYSFTVYKGVIWWEKMVPSTRKRMESSKMAENTPMAHLHSEQPKNEANSVLHIEDIKSHSAPSSAEPCGPYADPDS